MKRLDLVGQTFGEWVVIGPIGKQQGFTKAGKSVTRLGWLCECSCKKQSWVTTQNLRNQQSTRCRDCSKLPLGVAAFRDLRSRYSRSAKVRGHAWSLSDEQIQKLFTGNCCYCGNQPSATLDNPQLNGKYVYNGIDRVDSSQGYTPSNCVSCCKLCNYMKRSLAVKEFLEHIGKICSYKLEAL